MSAQTDSFEIFYSYLANDQYADLEPWLNSMARHTISYGENFEVSVGGKARFVSSLQRVRYGLDRPTMFNLRVRSYNEQVSAVDGAFACLEAMYDLRGRYVQPLPGLDGIVPATRASAALSVRDLVWINSEGKILCMKTYIRMGQLS